jgi:hypothetical protein
LTRPQICSENRTGQTCKIFLKRFPDTTGSYRMVSIAGFEKYAKLMGD